MVVSRFVLFAGLSVSMGVASAASAAYIPLDGPARILAMGDSITQGHGSGAGSIRETTGGYRSALDELLGGVGYNFIGGKGDGDASSYGSGVNDSWRRHYGRPGIQADSTDTYGNTQPPYSTLSSLVDHIVERSAWINNKTDGGTIRHPALGSSHDFRNEVWGGTAAPNVILLHIGTNTLGPDSTTMSEAVRQTERLLQVFDLLRSTTVPGTSETFLPSNVQIMLAAITPDTSGNTNTQKRATVENTWDYNYNHIFNKTSSLYDELSQGLVDQITPVDHFMVRVDDVMDQLLSLDRYASYTEASLAALLNVDSDEFVDWVAGEYDELLDNFRPGSGYSSTNGNLMADAVHPTQLGYDVMAAVWDNSLGGVVPEPATLALLVLGGAVAVSRRGRLA